MSSARVLMAILTAPAILPLGGCGGGSAGPGPTAELASLEREIRRTNEILLRIEARLDAGAGISRREPGVSPAAPDREPAVAAGTEVAQALKGLRDEVAALRLRGGPPPAPEAALPKQDAALSELSRQYHADAAHQDLKHFLWTPRDVYQAYGKPDDTSSSGNQVIWNYVLGERSGVAFTFADGYVVRTESWSP